MQRTGPRGHKREGEGDFDHDIGRYRVPPLIRLLVRADTVYQELENGGRLFATGSITICGSLLVNGGDNSISRLLDNVIRRFLE